MGGVDQELWATITSPECVALGRVMKCRKVCRKLVKVMKIGSFGRSDGLIGISCNAKIGVFADKMAKDLALGGVDILVVVRVNGAKAQAKLLSKRGIMLKKAYAFKQKIIEIQRRFVL